MIPYQTHPILLELGWFKIYTYGFFVALGVLLATYVAVREAKRLKFDPDIMYNIVVIVVLSIIIGSRAVFVAENWDYFSQNLIDIVRFWEGGVSFFGGFILAVLLSYGYLKKVKAPLGKVFDAAAIALPFGHFIGRIGCWFRGCCYGLETSMPWGVVHEGALRHPTQAYSAIGNLILFIVLSQVKEKKQLQGRLFVVYLMLYSAMRFVIEFFRVGTRYFWNLTLPQIFSLVILIGAAVFFFRKK